MKKIGLSEKRKVALILAAFFTLTFAAVFLIISTTQSARSKPERYASEVDGMAITIGPKPNSTGVSLDTTVTIDALSSAALDDLRLTPLVPIAGITSEVSGPLSYQQTFYPAQLLKPATFYTVTVTIRDVVFSWSFTTTSDPYHPTVGFYLATYVVWIAVSVAIVATLIVGLAFQYRKKGRRRVLRPQRSNPSYLDPNSRCMQKHIGGYSAQRTGAYSTFVVVVCG